MGQVTLTLPTLAFASRTVSILETYATSFLSSSQSRIDIRFRIQFRSLLYEREGHRLYIVTSAFLRKRNCIIVLSFFFFFFFT